MPKSYTIVEEPILKPGDYVKINGNAPGTVWEYGVIECIKDGRAYILYGVKRLNDWTGIRGMCTGESLQNLERCEQ